MSRRQRAVRGIFLTCLLGWSAGILLTLISRWMTDQFGSGSRIDWWVVPCAIAWLGFYPVCGFVMGVVHVYLCPTSVFTQVEQRDQGRVCKLVFWGPWLVMLLTSCCCLVPVALPLFHISFDNGQIVGNRWVEAGALQIWFGRRNQWERAEDDREDGAG